MRSFLKNHHRVLFFTGWLIINLIQAATTEFFDDEAYYWIYSQYPAWGYFDHPPMIAILIKAGYAIFKSELGVRFFIILMNTATILLTSYLINNRNDKLFYAISLSIAVAQIGGIIAVPDVPLLFFVTLFFSVYKRFVQNMSLLNSFLLGVSIASMVYTKYHGVLIVFFTLLSNVKLFSRYQTYLVAAISLLLFSPHLYWQYIHGFPSVQYHLFERNASSYRLTFTTEYIVSQLALAGPVIGWLLIWASIRYKSSSTVEKALKYTLVGFYLFFMISTLKGRVEANWTVPVFVALIVLSHQYLNQHHHIATWVYRSLPLTLLIVVVFRIYMMLDLSTSDKIRKDEFHQNKEWVKIISQKANGLPVVFINSYQWSSKYWFYKHETALGLNTPYYRRNNFNFWPVEDEFFGKRVFAIGDYGKVVLKDKIIAPRFKEKGSAVIPFYYSFMKAQFTRIRNKVTPNAIASSFDITVPERYLPYFRQPPFDTASIQLAIVTSDTIRYYRSAATVKQITGPSSHLSVNFPHQLPKGLYEARLGISSAIPEYPTLNSTNFQIRVE